MKTLHSFAELACACCGTVDDGINAEVAKFGTMDGPKFAVHYTVVLSGRNGSAIVPANTPEEARKALTEAYGSVKIIVRKTKRSA
jgi:hypothetical protein